MFIMTVLIPLGVDTVIRELFGPSYYRYKVNQSKFPHIKINLGLRGYVPQAGESYIDFNSLPPNVQFQLLQAIKYV